MVAIMGLIKSHLYPELLSQKLNPKIMGETGIITWESCKLPYEDLEFIITLVGQTDYELIDFNFSCRAFGGDSCYYELTFHIKQLQQKP